MVYWKKIDQLFLKDKSTRQYSAFRETYNVKRDNNQSVEEFITKFEQILFKMNKLEMKLPDAVAAFMLTSVTHLCRLPDLPVPYWRDLKGGNTSSAPGGLNGPRPNDKQEMRKQPPGKVSRLISNTNLLKGYYYQRKSI